MGSELLEHGSIAGGSWWEMVKKHETKGDNKDAEEQKMEVGQNDNVNGMNILQIWTWF